MTDKILPQIEDWQNRPLDEVYLILFIVAIHYSFRDNGGIRKPLPLPFQRQNINAASSIGHQMIIYTTNAIESLNSTYRRLNQQRSVFPSDTVLLKALHLATFEATKRWTTTIRNWGQVYGELSIMYEGRLPE